MTFKHIKFEDSAVMRSLEKLYKEKGLLKEEPIKKEASSKLDLRASSNLMENILKLCNGLRSYGLDKQANELELNYLSYKKANTLYETSKETGEDLVHSAHPKGSHKVDVLGDDLAVVETILDNHLKMLKVVDKVPTGKLASNNIINSVKKALGEDVEFKEFISIISDFSRFIGYISDNFNLTQRKFEKPSSAIGLLRALTPSAPLRSVTDEARIIKFKDEIQNLARSKAFTSRTIFEIIEIMNKIIVILKEVKITQESNLTLEQKSSLIKRMESFIVQLNNLSTKVQSRDEVRYLNKPTDVEQKSESPKNAPAANVTIEPSNIINEKINKSLNLINRYQNELNADLSLSDKDKLNGKNWLEAQKTKYATQLDSFKSTPEENKKDIMPKILQNIDYLDSKLQTFYKEFLA